MSTGNSIIDVHCLSFREVIIIEIKIYLGLEFEVAIITSKQEIIVLFNNLFTDKWAVRT